MPRQKPLAYVERAGKIHCCSQAITSPVYLLAQFLNFICLIAAAGIITDVIKMTGIFKKRKRQRMFQPQRESQEDLEDPLKSDKQLLG